MCTHTQHVCSGLATGYGPNSARGREQASPHHSAALLAHTRQLLHDTMTLEACSSAPGWRTTECAPSRTSKRPHASNHTEPQHTNAGETTLPTSDTATSRGDAQRRRRNHTNLRHLNCLIAGETTQRRHTALTDIPCCTHANGPPLPATQKLRGRRPLLQLLCPPSHPAAAGETTTSSISMDHQSSTPNTPSAAGETIRLHITVKPSHARHKMCTFHFRATFATHKRHHMRHKICTFYFRATFATQKRHHTRHKICTFYFRATFATHKDVITRVFYFHAHCTLYNKPPYIAPITFMRIATNHNSQLARMITTYIHTSVFRTSLLHCDNNTRTQHAFYFHTHLTQRFTYYLCTPQINSYGSTYYNNHNDQLTTLTRYALSQYALLPVEYLSIATARHPPEPPSAHAAVEHSYAPRFFFFF
jgi:hypothetical protein